MNATVAALLIIVDSHLERTTINIIHYKKERLKGFEDVEGVCEDRCALMLLINRGGPVEDGMYLEYRPKCVCCTS